VQYDYVQGFGRRPEGRRLLGRTEHQWVDNTRTGIEAIGWKYLDIVSCTHGNEPYGSIKCGYFLD
jgi:hypothetical protein